MSRVKGEKREKNREKSDPCLRCCGTGELGSEIHHGHGWAIAVDRKDGPCPACGGSGVADGSREGGRK